MKRESTNSLTETPDGSEAARRPDAKLKMFAILFSDLNLEEEAYAVAHEISELLKDDLQRSGATLKRP